MKKLILLLCSLLLIGCKETVVEPHNYGDDNLGIKFIESKKYEKREDENILIYHHMEKFNRSGFLMNFTGYNVAEEGEINTKYGWFYDGDDNILKSLKYTNGELDRETKFAYKNKKIYKEESYHDGELVYRTTYEYKENYKKTTTVFQSDGMKAVNEELHNDDGSYTVKRTWEDFEGSTAYINKFNSDNQVLETVRFESDNLIESITCEYDDKGNNTKIVTVNSNGDENVASLEYDEFDNCILYRDNSCLEWDKEYSYEYDEKGNYISKVEKRFGEIYCYEERTITYWE